MSSFEHEPSKRILLTAPAVPQSCLLVALVIPTWIILHLNKDKLVNAEYVDVFFAVVLLLGIILGYLGYLAYHITFDQNGIDIYKWRKKNHVSWDQIPVCIFTQFACYKHVTFHIKQGEESFIIMARCTKKMKNNLIYYLQQYDTRVIDSWNKQKTRSRRS